MRFALAPFVPPWGLGGKKTMRPARLTALNNLFELDTRAVLMAAPRLVLAPRGAGRFFGRGVRLLFRRAGEAWLGKGYGGWQGACPGLMPAGALATLDS